MGKRITSHNKEEFIKLYSAKVKEICKLLDNCELVDIFSGEDDGSLKRHTARLNMRCLGCGETKIIKLHNFLSSQPLDSKYKGLCSKCSSRLSLGISEAEALENINSRCNELGYKFLGFETKWENNLSRINLCCDNNHNINIDYSNFCNRSEYRCPKCLFNWKMEDLVISILNKNNFEYISQWTDSWMRYKSNLKLDFIIPNLNIAIECQGEQHFRPINYFGGEEKYKIQCERDLLKYNLCKEHGITILYYTDVPKSKINFFAPVYTDINELLNEIKKYIN